MDRKSMFALKRGPSSLAAVDDDVALFSGAETAGRGGMMHRPENGRCNAVLRNVL